MKKIYLISMLIFITKFALSQTIVETSVEKKNVILEEFTGIHCGYCPDGHQRAQAIKDAYPDDVFLINIHTGGYATPSAGEPDFRTSFGDLIASQSELTGYPSGTVNRTVFSGYSVTALSRDVWASKSDLILADDSYVNVGVEAEINVAERELTVHIEAYYTANSTESVNYLNVALLQNNTLGPQSGGNMGNEYIHQHRLVHLLTGQWGEEISTTTTSSFIDKTYKYTIPADFNLVEADIAELEIVAFVSETHQKIISGNGCTPTFTNFNYANDASIFDIQIPGFCGNSIMPSISVKNYGSDDITSLNFEYSINNGTVENYVWTGRISPLKTEQISLNGISFDEQEVNSIQVSIASDEDESNNTANSNFDLYNTTSSILTLDLKTDKYGSEISWSLLDKDGNVLYSGGPYIDGFAKQVNETFTLTNDCYSFQITDSYGDGVTDGTSGHLFLKDDKGEILMYFPDGNFGSGADVFFATKSTVGINNLNETKLEIYPNPVRDILKIKDIKNANIKIFNLIGNLVLSKENINNNDAIEVSNLTPGTYFIKIEENNSVKTSKIIIED